ncbi:MAG: hypothetical protein CFE21_07895 [Bacteroidetes bacterium B1(2017)]|nr:MAG: hypothetical protein CFE21_07895 [Bacteroidetes bacterium B1(2017)]
MKSLYDIETLAEVLDRVSQIKADTTPIWGKMNAAQMMEHCARALDFVTGKTKPPRTLLGYILGSFIKTQYFNDTPWRKNSPTSKQYLVVDDRSFLRGKDRLERLLKEFSLGGMANCTTHPSPFFGKLTAQQHGLGQYKHIDHHLKQFGV